MAACGDELPIWIKGNAGRPEMDAAGVRFIGGCCGSTPAHVRAIVGAIDRLGVGAAGSAAN